MLLIGNKTDLTEERKINEPQIQAWMEDNPFFSKYIEASAKSNIGVEEVFN